MKTIDELSAEFHEAVGPHFKWVDGTLRGCLSDAWHSGRQEGLDIQMDYGDWPPFVFSERDEVEAGIEFLNEREEQ